MPQRKRRIRRRAARLVLFSLATWALAALSRERSDVPGRAGDRPAGSGTDGGAGRQDRPTAAVREQTRAPAPLSRRRRRLASSFTFAVLFCAGASFSALAGDQTAQLLEEDAAELAAATAAEVPAAEEAPEEAAAPEPQPELLPSDEAPAEAPEDLAVEPVAGFAPPAPELQEHPAATPAPAAKPRRTRSVSVLVPKPKPQPLDPEASAPDTAATVWLNRPLGDPTPPSLRLSRAVAQRLLRAGRAHRVDWALVLGVLRADGVRRALPNRAVSIEETAALLAAANAPRRPAAGLDPEALGRYHQRAWSAALAVSGRTTRADRALALARYYRAVGLEALVRGLTAESERLADRLLADPRVALYAGGRVDVEAGRIDVRVLALVAYLAESHGQVTVSSLFTGHRLYARPGVVSAHVYGQAVDIASLGGVPIAGHQEPGSVTERAVRDILLLPAEVLPRQVISLLGLGGPSFPLADHDDHIHVGF